MRARASLASLLAGVAAAAVCCLVTEGICEWRDRRRYPAPGKIHSGRHVMLSYSSGLPPVVLEAGLAATSLSWSRVLPLLSARGMLSVAHDRAGLGWSAPSDAPRTLPVLVDELAAVLTASAIPAPYVLVGHSFGALVVRAFAAAHPELVAGLVLVDPASIAHWAKPSLLEQKRLATGARLARRGASLARFGIVRFALSAAATVQRRRMATGIARLAAGHAGASLLSRLAGEVSKLPPALLPVVQAHWSTPKSFVALASYLEALPICASAAAQSGPSASIPLVILSAATATAAERAERDSWISRHPHSRHTLIPGTGHWLHLERPEAVLDAVRFVISHRP